MISSQPTTKCCQDERLRFTNLTCMEVINGEDYFTSFIWTPNIFIENGRESTLMRTTGDSSYVRIFHTGEVELTGANFRAN